ncbi:uncharacterized protein LOC143182189 isoform X2 [Calliopsis andreniformis]|uniref:uncharacterized protein LOC143182189 isoform X2 n=1 Tax=Calliopsis andreniformis TaxID=337506 RepID=UPI003FCD7FF8
MGAASSNNNAPPPSAPLRERSEETFTYGAQESCCAEHTNENIRQRTKTSTFDVGEEPQSQGPSPYTTLKGDESWNQRPSAPNLSNLTSPRRETLLTYVAQMTGWQAAEEHSPSLPQQHQEAMELSRVISQLAAANQQLANAYTTTLGHLEALYVELKKEKESKRQVISSNMEDEAVKRRLTVQTEGADEEEEKRRSIEFRVTRLESLLANNWDTCRSKQKNLRQEEGRNLRSRIDRLELLTKIRPEREDEQECTNVCLSAESRDLIDSHQTVDVACDFVRNKSLHSADTSEQELRSQHLVNRIGMSGEDRPRSIHSTHSTNLIQVDDSRFTDETDRPIMNLHLEMSKTLESRVTDEENLADSTVKMDVTRLSEEIERLKSERLEYQSVNQRLANELAEEKAMVEKLTKEYEESKTRQKQVESTLQEHREDYDKLMAKFDSATKETERLLQEIDSFNTHKDTAEAKISSLEEDLQKLLLEKEQIKSIESQKTTKLKAQLSEEVSDKKKQIKALEDALDEIQRLKETIKTGRNYDDNDTSSGNVDPSESIDDPQESPPAGHATNIEEFKKELTLKREARQRAIAAVSSEMERLRRELDAEKEAHSETSRVLELLRSAQNDSQSQAQTNAVDTSGRKSRVTDQQPDEQELAAKRLEAQRLSSILKVSDELRNDIRYQIEKVDDLRYHLEIEPDQHRYRIRCLSNITNKTREALYARERRANELKDHLAQMLVRLGDRSFLDVKDGVGLECERQLENINSLKSLYNERLKIVTELKDTAVKELADIKERLDYTLKKSECLEEDLKKADEKIDVQDSEISNLESQLGLTKADCRDLQNQMSLINGLFTQMLIGASSADMDLDRLTQLLQENHDLICDMAREESTEAAALPKLLLDLVEQVEGNKGNQKRADGESNTAESDAEKKEEDLQQEEIAHKLPKVWRVLLELLSCHAEADSSTSAASSSDTNSCYKSVDTPAGPRLVISVSKTYIRLKELILEKKHLEKEMNRMKQLNTHLESKLSEQEKRLSAVSAELSKTWTIVDRMQAQHQQLHTHEKILRYELQQKRKMLQELKQELEYCREKWESARQKNTNTELEWRSLRREFAARKALVVQDSFSNSAESGFSDERGDDTDEEDNAVEERIRLGPRRKPRKESPRAPTPDTESEQPTDTELSEPKTSSSTTLEQRTPTPETETELDETEQDTTLNIQAANITERTQLLSENSQESLDPLDQALTNVIQNLIGLSESNTISIPLTSSTMEANNAENLEEDDLTFLENSAARSLDLESQTLIHTQDPDTNNDTSEPPIVSDVSIDLSSNVTEDSPKTMDTDVFGPPLSDSEDPFDSVSFSSSFDSSSSVATVVQERESKSPEKCRVKSVESVIDSDSAPIDSSSSMETAKEVSSADSVPSCSLKETDTKETTEASVSKQEESVAKPKIRTPEEALAAREDRLKRLEEQAKWLVNKMNATSKRSSALNTRLEELHEVYGEPPVPPPMPDVLPTRRLRTTLTDLPQQVPESSSTEGTENIEKPVSSSGSDESQP